MIKYRIKEIQGPSGSIFIPEQSDDGVEFEPIPNCRDTIYFTFDEAWNRICRIRRQTQELKIIYHPFN